MCVRGMCSKLGVPIKTTVPVAVLKEALDRSVKVFQLELGQSERRKVGNKYSCPLCNLFFHVSK